MMTLASVFCRAFKELRGVCDNPRPLGSGLLPGSRSLPYGEAF